MPVKNMRSFILLRKNESIGRFEILNDMAKAIKKAKPSTVQPKFSWAKAAAQTLQVYQEVLELV